MNDEIKKRVIEKIVNTFISLKFWALVIISVISTLLLLKDKITGSEWATVIITLYTAILGIREYGKRTYLNGNNNYNNHYKEESKE